MPGLGRDGGRDHGRSLPSRLAWFAGLWLLGVGAVMAVGLLIKWVL